MKISTALPLSHTAFAHWHTDDTEIGVVVAKAAFVLTADGKTTPQVPAPDINLVDVYDGDPALTPLVAEQDIAPGKTKTDLIVRGAARSYEGTPRADWAVNIAILDVMNYGFHVRGPSQWTKNRKKWDLSKPDPVTEVPLTYALAYGGSCAVGDDVTFFEQNPTGIGFMTEQAAPDAGWSAPQIGLLAEFMAAEPFTPMAVHGTMPVAKTWLPRRALAGTFDKAWERDRHPRMPADYDLRFWNAAPMRLQIGPYLTGNETIEMRGISHLHDTVGMQLPGATLMLQSQTDRALPAIGMALDTVDMDMSLIDDGQVTTTLIWRALVSDRDSYRHAEILRG